MSKSGMPAMSVESGLPADLFQHGHEQNLGENRRKATGSHYSDLDLALEVVRATLEPIFAAALNVRENRSPAKHYDNLDAHLDSQDIQDTSPLLYRVLRGTSVLDKE
jgi:hypothetical protein